MTQSKKSCPILPGALCIASLGAAGLFSFHTQQRPRDGSAELWEQLRAHDQDISRARVLWSSVYEAKPQPSTDEDQAAARIRTAARANGTSANVIVQLERAERRFAKRQKTGYRSFQEISCLRNGKALRFEVQSSDPASPTATGAPLDALLIDYYDGRDAITVLQSRPSYPAASAAKRAVLVGDLERSPAEKLPHIGYDTALMLSGSPLFVDCNQNNSIWRVAGKDRLILEKKLAGNAATSGVGVLQRWTVARSTWRPLQLETLFDLRDNTNPISRTRFLDYKAYPGGALFPARIVRESRSGTPALKGKQPSTVTTYLVRSAAFNGSVPYSVLAAPIPQGTYITDKRFGPAGFVSYQVKTGIPTDAEVLRMLQEKRAGGR